MEPLKPRGVRKHSNIRFKNQKPIRKLERRPIARVELADFSKTKGLFVLDFFESKERLLKCDDSTWSLINLILFAKLREKISKTDENLFRF